MVKVIVTHDVHHDEHDVHHHKETFITKYVFSQDHKMICKQFLITGMIWAILGGLMSVSVPSAAGLSRFNFSHGWKTFLGKWAKGGQIQPEFYYALVTMHGTVLVFFVLTGGLERNFRQFPDSLADRCTGYGFSLSEYAFLLVLLDGQRGNDHLPCLLKPVLPAAAGRSYPPLSALGDASEGPKPGWISGLRAYGIIRGVIPAGWSELYFYHPEHAYKGNEHDTTATDHLGIVLYRYFGCTYHSRYLLSGFILLLFDRHAGTSFYLSDIFIDCDQ